MRVIVAGSREITDQLTVTMAMNSAPFDYTHVLLGGARGVDTLAQRVCEQSGIPFTIYPADWETYGKRAGYLRNVDMADNADALVAVWDGQSKGTAHMIDIARARGLLISYRIVDQEQH